MIAVLHLARLIVTAILIVAIYDGSRLALVAVLLVLVLVQEAQASAFRKVERAAVDTRDAALKAASRMSSVILGGAGQARDRVN